MKQSSKSDSDQSIQVSNAGVLVRLAALLYDGLLVLGIWFVIGGIAVAINGGEGVHANNPFFPAILFVVTFWFNTHFWRRGGQTLGMRAWRLRLLDQQGKNHLTFTQCFLRYLGAIGALLSCGLGYLWLLVDKDKLTWQDRLSDTRVIREPKD